MCPWFLVGYQSWSPVWIDFIRRWSNWESRGTSRNSWQTQMQGRETCTRLCWHRALASVCLLKVTKKYWDLYVASLLVNTHTVKRLFLFIYFVCNFRSRLFSPTCTRPLFNTSYSLYSSESCCCRVGTECSDKSSFKTGTHEHISIWKWRLS